MLINAVIVIVFVYVVLNVLLYIGQGRLLFFPSRDMGVTPDVYGWDYEDVTLEVLGQAGGDGENGHDLRGHGDLESAAHHEPVHMPTDTNDHLPEGLGTEVHGPLDVHVTGIDVQATEVLTRQDLITVVELVLHPAGGCHHGQIVGVVDGVDVTRETEAEVGKGNTLGQSTAGSGTLDVEGRAAGGLPDSGDDLLAKATQSLG